MSRRGGRERPQTEGYAELNRQTRTGCCPPHGPVKVGSLDIEHGAGNGKPACDGQSGGWTARFRCRTEYAVSKSLGRVRAGASAGPVGRRRCLEFRCRRRPRRGVERGRRLVGSGVSSRVGGGVSSRTVTCKKARTDPLARHSQPWDRWDGASSQCRQASPVRQGARFRGTAPGGRHRRLSRVRCADRIPRGTNQRAFRVGYSTGLSAEPGIGDATASRRVQSGLAFTHG